MALGLFGRRWLWQGGLGPVLGGVVCPAPSGSLADLPLVTLPTNGRIENDQHEASLCEPSNR
ncbi:hypothetical protein SAMN05428964_10479 [Thalassospira xiamenensis]|uniref:Uncharacterized protein n=2 Tax=Thalassospira xiamenensis TaxID=220697 RepID=A0A285TLK6_9PROT|nr:hypothetical protein SAMN05428964_10479 [Thalassospira xiamenensis]